MVLRADTGVCPNEIPTAPPRKSKSSGATETDAVALVRRKAAATNGATRVVTIEGPGTAPLNTVGAACRPLRIVIGTGKNNSPNRTNRCTIPIHYPPYRNIRQD